MMTQMNTTMMKPTITTAMTTMMNSTITTAMMTMMNNTKAKAIVKTKKPNNPKSAKAHENKTNQID